MTEAEKAYQYFVIAVPESEEQAKAYFWARKALQSTLTQPNEWVSVEDNMPPERDSIFKRFKGTPKWKPVLFEKISDTVNVAVEFKDGTRKTCSAHTTDGEWRGLPEVGNPIVTHWMPLPEPPDRRPPEGEA